MMLRSVLCLNPQWDWWWLFIRQCDDRQNFLAWISGPRRLFSKCSSCGRWGETEQFSLLLEVGAVQMCCSQSLFCLSFFGEFFEAAMDGHRALDTSKMKHGKPLTWYCPSHDCQAWFGFKPLVLATGMKSHQNKQTCPGHLPVYACSATLSCATRWCSKSLHIWCKQRTQVTN